MINSDEKIIDVTNLSEEEREFLEQAVISELMYDAVLDELNFSAKDSETVRCFLKGILKKSAQAHIVTEILRNMDDEQLEHFNAFIKSMAVTSPEIGKDTLIVDFSLRYPPLLQKVYASLEKFFDEFVEDYNRMHGE